MGVNSKLELIVYRGNYYRFTTYQDARRVRLVDGLIFETNILRVSPVILRVISKGGIIV